MADWTVTTGGDPDVNGTNFQDVLDNDAALGDTIILQAGAEYRGNFVLPDYGAGTNYVTIRTSNLAGLPPEGTRITNAYGSAMPKLVANSSAPAIEGEANSHHFTFIGIEITNIGGSTVTQELILLGARSSGGNLPFVQHPHHIIFDRCWIHEATNDTSTPDSIETTAIRGFNLNATDVVIKESRIAGFRTYQPTPNGVEASHTILLPNSALRVTIENNYLESWFCPIFMGGASGESANIATLSSVSFDTEAHTGSATFSSVANLSVGDLVAFKTTGGLTPATNGAHPSEAVAFQVGKVTDISGSVVSFQSWGAFDGDIAGGNPLLQAPDSPGQAQWNGYLDEDINILKNEFILNFASTEEVWVATGGDPTTDPRATQSTPGTAPKGFVEIKMGRNVLIEGNTFDGWMNGIVVTSRNQGNALTSGAFPWFGIFDLVIRNNWWKRMVNWDRIFSITIGGPLLQDNEYTSVRSGPFTFTNNLVESGAEYVLASMISADDVTVTHNTWTGVETPIGGNGMIFAHSADSPNFTFKDNIVFHNENGQFCVDLGDCWPTGGPIQEKNVIIDNRSSAAQIADGPLDSRYPDDFIVLDHDDVGWADRVTGGLEGYRLTIDSDFKGMASDATDPGVNIDALIVALGLPSGRKTKKGRVIRGRH